MPPPVPQNPFPGPRPYTSAEQAAFFGRAGERRDLAALVIANRLTVLYGKTGAGKTSLLAAGLVPELERAGFQVLPVARPGGVLPPGTDPATLRNVYTANVLMHWHRGDLAGVVPHTLLSYLRELPQVDEHKDRPLVVLLDQFEDLFTTHATQWEQRGAFVRELAECVAEAGRERPLRVLISIRDEQLAELERFAPLLPDLLRVRMRLDPLRVPAAIEVITGAARGLFTRPDADKLAQDLAHERVRVGGKLQLVASEFVEPMQLQLACEEKWRRGGRSGPLARPLDPDEALVRFYDAAVARARAGWGAERKIRRFVQDRLVAADGGRGAVLRGKRSTGGLANKLVDRLERERILRVEERLDARWYELAHDRLVAPTRLANQTWFESQRRRRKALRVTLWLLLLAGVGAGAFFTVQWGLARYRGLDDEKRTVEQRLADAEAAGKKLEGKLAKKSALLAAERLRSRLHRLDAEVAALAGDVLALQGVVAAMGRYSPSARDVETEAESLTNYATTGAELPALVTRVDAATEALAAIDGEIEAARDDHPAAAADLKDLAGESAARAPELARLAAAIDATLADHARHSARLLAELATFETPPRPGSGNAGRARELARESWRAGLRALLSGQTDEARAAFARAQSRDPGYAAAHDMVGRLAWAAGDAKAAEQSFRRALALAPTYGPSLASMAAIYLGKDWLLDAEHCARQALAASPDYGPAFALLRDVQLHRAAQTEPEEDELSRKNPCSPAAPAEAPAVTDDAPAEPPPAKPSQPAKPPRPRPRPAATEAPAEPAPAADPPGG